MARLKKIISPSHVIYSIFIPSFCDGNKDGIGDLAGVYNQLDYLSKLGVDMIWLSPFHKSPSYHKYDVTDYKSIDPSFGSVEEIHNIIDKAHELGISVIMDFVLNHTSWNHEWFQRAMKSPDSPYRQFYIWKDKDAAEKELKKQSISADSDNYFQWHLANEEDDQMYYGFFWKGMPDLNMDHHKVRSELYEIGKFWIKEFGFDGFRLDAAKHIYPKENHEKSILFWREFVREMRQIKSDVFAVGEVWDEFEVVSEYAQALPALFDFDFSLNIAESINTGDSTALLDYATQRRKFREIDPSFESIMFLSNHDQDRIASQLEGNIEKIKLAASILLLLPSRVCIYYGEEIGMLGQKPDPNIREPFLWDQSSEDGQRTTWIDPEFSTEESVVPLRTQMDQDDSIWQHYHKLIEFRKEIPHLLDMDLTILNTLKTFQFEIHDHELKLRVIHNLHDKSCAINVLSNSVVLDLGLEEKNGKYRLKPFGSVVYEIPQ